MGKNPGPASQRGAFLFGDCIACTGEAFKRETDHQSGARDISECLF